MTAVMPAAQAERAFTGVISARVQSNLGFRVAGKIIERLVDTGQVVKVDQPLMRIDQTDLDLAIITKEKAVASARAVAVQAAADEARYAELRKAGWSTQQKALPLLRQGSSVIINSSVGARKEWPTTSTVSTCKAALNHLARILGAELVDRGIRATCCSTSATPRVDVLESGIFSPRKKEVQMTIGAVVLLRKRWASLMAWVAAMDYSAPDYTNDRIGGLEREVEQLKDELRRTRRSAGAADGGF